MMTEAEVYEFDLNGLIVYRNMIPPEDVARMNELIDAIRVENSSEFLSPLRPLFMNLMAPLNARRHAHHHRGLDAIRPPWAADDQRIRSPRESAWWSARRPGRAPIPVGLQAHERLIVVIRS